MLTSYSPPVVPLTAAERERLEALAPYFGIRFIPIENGAQLQWSSRDGLPQTVELTSLIMHHRLLAEICSRITPWVYFHIGEPVQFTFFEHTDSRLHRIAYLYGESLLKENPTSESMSD